jgi:hypothetical protein
MRLVSKIVLYDLSVMPTTFDFACTAVMAKTLGYEEIRFVIDKPMTEWKYPAKIGWRRWANILVPICDLADLSFSVGREIQGDVLGYSTGEVERLYQKTQRITKLRSIVPIEKSGYITITLRQSFRNEWRNSSPDWLKVAEWLKSEGEEVYLLEESEELPLPIERRMAIYSQAKMNLSVGNGPMVLCWLSEAPYLSFQLPKGPEKEYNALIAQWDRMGFPVGSQLSFRNERQEIVWDTDDYEVVKTYCKKHLFDKKLRKGADFRTNERHQA